MAKSEIKRNYRMTDAELCMFTSNLCNVLTRDLTDLAAYGIDAAKVTALKNMGDEFEATQTDDYYRGEVRVATENKIAAEELVRDTIRSMSARAALKWGINSGKYARLGLKGMAKFKEDKFLLKARDVHTFLCTQLAELADVGMTQEMLDDFADYNEALELTRNEQYNAIDRRDHYTAERARKGNKLYALVKNYCDIGKKIYFKTEPAKYNDYVIYQKPAGGLKKPENFFYDYYGKTFWWNTVKHATSYQIQRSDGGEFHEIYAGGNTHFEYTPPDGLSIYRVRARNNNGFGPFSDEKEYWYFAVLPSPINVQIIQDPQEPTNCKVIWDKVPTVTEYTVYRSAVNIGQPSSNFEYMGITEDNQYNGNLVLGKRNYFRINATNNIQYSHSVPVWVEV